MRGEAEALARRLQQGLALLSILRLFGSCHDDIWLQMYQGYDTWK